MKSKEGLDGVTGNKVKVLEKKMKEIEKALKLLYMVTEKIIQEGGARAEPEMKLAPLDPNDYKRYIG